MTYAGWLTFVFSIVLSIASYLWAHSAFRGAKSVPLDTYLFAGNSNMACMFSIVGAVISAAFLFTGVSAAYLQYGLYFLPVIVATSIYGLKLTRNTLGDTMKSRHVDTSPSPVIAIRRLGDLATSSTNAPAYVLLSLLYLFGVLQVEFSVFRAALAYLLPGDNWSNLVPFLVVITIAAYVYVGGFKGVLRTDILQFFIVAGAMTFLVWTSPTTKVGQFIQMQGLVCGIWDCALGTTAIGILLVAWFSSAPELHLRLATLSAPNDVRKVTWLSAILVQLMAAVPVFVLLSAGAATKDFRNPSTVFEIWNIVVGGREASVAVVFLFLVVTAVFTTIDTLAISFSQLLRVLGELKPESERYLPRGQIRVLTLLFIALSVYVATLLPFQWTNGLGLYALCLTISLFFMLYVRPHMGRNRNPEVTPSWIWLLPHAFGPLLIWGLVAGLNAGYLMYPIIPFYILLAHTGLYLMHLRRQSRERA